MRYYGTIIRWNKERGFGAVADESGEKEYFAPLSAFEEQSPLPEEGRRVSFEITVGRRGREEAENIRYPGEGELAAHSLFKDGKKSLPPALRKLLTALPVACAVAVGIWFAKPYLSGITLYKKHTEEVTAEKVAKEIMKEREAWKQAVSSPLEPKAHASADGNAFSCDGRQHCSQMRSLKEAEFFLQQCPNVKMDGDNDGIPCENHSFNDTETPLQQPTENTAEKKSLWDKISSFLSSDNGASNRSARR
ncbi:excalibur calcium-binding domain-containing protein [Neisseria sp.]|uniref:excalibur calcium-binding domain-containing protein n=1 Tax=Neisseria sp. TaxID=192066 RepID=UPI0035A0830E